MDLARKTPPPSPATDLYETDYSRWLFENARLLREGRLMEADIANSVFPSACPYTPQQVQDPDFWPGSD